MKRICIFIFMFILIHTPTYGAEPLDVLRQGVNQLITILNDPQYQDEAQRRSQKEMMWNTIRDIFDFQEMSKRAVGRYWKDFDKKQKMIFSRILSELLGRTYLDRIQRGFEDEKVYYLGQELITESKALVKTNIHKAGVEIPVYYNLLKEGETWKVYDINIEGVSLVKNYRTQCSQILVKRPPAKLIEILKAKIERQKSEGYRADRNRRILEQRMILAHLWQPSAGHFLRLK